MTAIDTLFKIAKAEEGYLEKSQSAYSKKHAIVYEKEAGAGKDNITKYWEDTYKGMQGQYWCQVFVFWCFVIAYGLEVAKKILYLADWTQGDPWTNFYTPDWANNFKAHGAYVQSSKVQPGDIVYFKNSQRIHHTGIVLAVERYSDGTGKLTTIEGNTSSGPDVAPNGGAVRIKEYPMTKNGISQVAWYGRPNYDLVPQTKRPTIKLGYNDKDMGNNWCAVLQDALKKLGFKGLNGSELAVDGDCGNNTVTAIKAFQSANGLQVDGKCGPKTWAAVDEALSKLTVRILPIKRPHPPRSLYR